MKQQFLENSIAYIYLLFLMNVYFMFTCLFILYLVDIMLIHNIIAL